MSDFDAAAARKAGYTEGEIADYLGKQRNFDVAGARKSGYSDADILTHLSKPKESNVPGAAATAAVDTVANIAGAPMDAATWLINNNPGTFLVNKGAKALGLPQIPKVTDPVLGSQSIKNALDYAATAPGRVSDAVSQGSLGPMTESRTLRTNPETTPEKTAYGMVEGVGNALSVALPAGAVARAMQGINALGPRIARLLAQQPVAQTLMGAVGGGVAGATDSPATGFAASLGVPVANALARRAITPFPTHTTPQEARLIQAADNNNIRLTPGTRTNNPTARMIEDTFAKSPGAAGPMQNTLREQRGDFNAAVMAPTGQTVRDASPDTIARTYRVLGQTFDDLVSRTTLNPDVQFARDIQTTANEYGRRLNTDQAPVFASYMQDIAPLIQAVGRPGVNPQITGEVFQNIRENLSRRIRRAHNEPDLQDALDGIATALDGVMERSATTPGLRQEWQEARRQYQALKTVDKAVSGGTQADRSAGDIPFGGLKGAAQRADPEGYARGRGQLNELSRVGDYLAARTPNSGTATRQAALNFWRWPDLAAARGMSSIYNMPGVQNYLANGLTGAQVNPANLRALLSSLAAQNAIDQTPVPPNALRPEGGR